jgi:ketosteroid isomerase-like protein
MNSRRMLISSLAAIVCTFACVKRADPDVERQQIEQLLQTYLQSVKTADVATAATIWMQRPDIVVVTPLGRYEGWDAVQREVYVNFLQKTFAERELQASNVHIHVNGDSAWAIFDWDFKGKLANGQSLTTKGRESHVYEKTADGWRITHLHYSALSPSS